MYALYIDRNVFDRRARYTTGKRLSVVLIIIHVEGYISDNRAVTDYAEQSVRSESAVYRITVTVKRSAETDRTVGVFPVAVVMYVYPRFFRTYVLRQSVISEHGVCCAGGHSRRKFVYRRNRFGNDEYVCRNNVILTVLFDGYA